MAYDSAFWDGTTTGHAATTTVWGAPYSSLEFSDIFSKLLMSYQAKGFVIPISYASDGLRASANSPAAMNVLVTRGVIYIWGRICESTATETLTIGTADATNPRIDRIVARLNITNQTWELAVVAGTAAATPSVPAVTQNATTYEIPIAYVWVAAGVTTITDTEIHDERIFSANFDEMLTIASQGNLVKNSEFMAFSRLSTVPTTVNGKPDGWELVGTVTAFANVTKPSQMSRGRAVSITAGAATSGMRQIFRVKASTLYSIKLLVNVTAGDVGDIEVTTNSASPGTVTKYIRRTGSWIEYLIYYTTESDATTLTLSLMGLNNTDVVSYGQALVTEGHVPGTFRQIHETIFFDHAIGDANWNTTAKSSGTTVIDLDTDFQALIPPGIRGLWVYLAANDSGSAAGSANLSLRSNGGTLSLVSVALNGVPNDTQRVEIGPVPVDADHQFDVSVLATGAGTLDAQIRFMGIVT